MNALKSAGYLYLLGIWEIRGDNMEQLPTFRIGLMNAWWLIIPLALPVAYVAATKREVARRMSDMAGYNASTGG